MIADGDGFTIVVGSLFSTCRTQKHLKPASQPASVRRTIVAFAVLLFLLMRIFDVFG